MIEVLFAESEVASMKDVKNAVLTGKTAGLVAVWSARKKKASKKEHTGWIEGTPEEVICLGFLLDIGDIRENVNSAYRKTLIHDLYTQEAWGKNPEVDAEFWNLADIYVRELQRLKNYLKKGETIRIWYSDAPYSVCGFYHVCSILSEANNQIRVVKLPEHIVRGSEVISYQHWGEVAAEEFAGFLPYERELSREEVRMYRALWMELQEDNMPLRAVINGKVMGVGEEFYDFLIWKELSQKPIKEARLIGNILGKYPISIGDWWYAKRIQQFIEQGNIKVMEDSENSYARRICLV